MKDWRKIEITDEYLFFILYIGISLIDIFIKSLLNILIKVITYFNKYKIELPYIRAKISLCAS